MQEIRRLGQEWVKAEKSQVPHDYAKMLKTVRHVFSTAESIENASKDELSDGLLSLHAFLERLRFVKGGRESLAPFFWNENRNDVPRVKKSLIWLIHGQGDFIERLHDLIYDQAWWLEQFGIFCALELFGTIRPDEFPPVNGRMAKALIRREDLVTYKAEESHAFRYIRRALANGTAHTFSKWTNRQKSHKYLA